MTNRSTTRRLLAGGALAATAALLAGCSTGPAAVTVEGGLEGILSADPSTFDPAHARAVNDYTLNRLLFDTVLRKGPDGLAAGLATDWTAESATSYRLTIGAGATCADGTEITADVVADSLTYLASPETKSTWKPLIFGGGDVTITADESDVIIELSTPFATVLDNLALPQSGIICPAGLKDLEGLAAGTVEGAYSGPYVVAKAETGIGYEVAFREDYDAWPTFSRELEGTAPESIYFSVSTDVNTITNQLLAGDINLALLAAGDHLDRLDDSLNITESYDVSVYLVFNERKGRFFADEDNRRAIAQAIDPVAFDAAFSGGRNLPIASVASPDLPCVINDRDLLVEQDADAAAATLAGTTFKFLSYTAIAAPATDYVFSALGNTGANVVIENPDIATWSATVNNPEADWDVAIFGDRNTARAVSASLDRFMGPSLEEGGRNVGAVANKVGADAFAEAMSTTDDAARCGLFETAQTSMLERVDLVPLVAAVQSTVTSGNVTVKAFGGSIDHSTLRIVSE